MGKFRKKPVVVEAFLVPPIDVDGLAVPLWLVSAIANKSVVPHREGGMSIITLEGTMRADVGDYVIRSVKGELLGCGDLAATLWGAFRWVGGFGVGGVGFLE